MVKDRLPSPAHVRPTAALTVDCATYKTRPSSHLLPAPYTYKVFKGAVLGSPTRPRGVRKGYLDWRKKIRGGYRSVRAIQQDLAVASIMHALLAGVYVASITRAKSRCGHPGTFRCHGFALLSPLLPDRTSGCRSQVIARIRIRAYRQTDSTLCSSIASPSRLSRDYCPKSEVAHCVSATILALAVSVIAAGR
jgi:hypothetical protein